MNTEALTAILQSAQFTVVGRAARAPEPRFLNGGKTVAKVRLAVSNGRDAESHWFTVEAWDALAQDLADRCDKGSELKVTGRILVEHYQTKAGEDRSDLVIKAQEIEVLPSRPKAFAAAVNPDALPF
ncbi:MAG: single-stranded DNA-binding protein [Hylemonella sp.]